MERGINKQQLIAELVRSPHGGVEKYIPLVTEAARIEPEFLAHLMAWGESRCHVRDAKVAVPVITLGTPGYPYVENSLAHLALLTPRDLARAVRFARGKISFGGNGKALRNLVERYLRVREADPGWFTAAAVSQRRAMKELYALNHIKPSPMARDILFTGARVKGSVFDEIARLGQMSVSEAAATIVKRRLPFLVLTRPLGTKLKEPDLAMAVLDQMTPTEVVTNSKMLERLGVKTNPGLRAAYEAKLGEISKSKKAVLKTSKAADAVVNEQTKEKLRASQERQIKRSVQGRWLVLVDKSASMHVSMPVARELAAYLTRVAEAVHLVFFDEVPRYVNATNATYEDLTKLMGSIRPGGNTSIGAAVQLAMDKSIEVDGIALVSDGGENRYPIAATVLGQYFTKMDKRVPVYFYKLKGQGDSFSPNMARLGLDVQQFDLTNAGLDYYSIPVLAETMRVERYSIYDEILNTELLTIDEALKRKERESGEHDRKAA